MGKLYYITGKDSQIREKVYCEILKWSQAEQMNPLQCYPPSEGDTPNFYLYDYLGCGDMEALPQLIINYGEDNVELIYLRLSNEAEELLLQEGIYKSFLPYPNLAYCLQEMIETVFTGYQKIAYDFEAVWKAEKIRAEEARNAEAEEALRKEKEQKRNIFFKKVIRPAILMITWVLLVCLVTVALFNAFTNQTDPNQKGGNLLVVTNPVNTTEPTSSQPISTPTPIESTQQNLFTQPMPRDYIIDISAPVKTSGQVGYHFNYTSEEQTYYNYLAGTGADLDADYYATSMDGSVGVVLLDSSLWYLNRTGLREVGDSISHCALAAFGNYVFYYADDGIYCLDPNNNTKEKLHSVPNIRGLVASPNGAYCAYLKNDGSVVIINRTKKTTQVVEGLGYKRLYTVSDNGNWVCGRGVLDGTDYLLRGGTNGVSKWLTNEKADCYIPFSGKDIIFEKMNQIWVSEASRGYPMQELGMSEDWRLLFTKENCLYEVADGIYLYDESAPFYVLIGDSLFTWEDEGGEYVLKLFSQDLLYAEGNVFLRQSDVNASLLNEIQYVVSATQDGTMLYVNKNDELYYYSAKAIDSKFVMIFSFMEDYAVAKDGTLYYHNSFGTLGYIKMNDTFFTLKPLETTFPIVGYKEFEVNNAGVYMYHYTSTSDSTADVYFVQEDTCLLLGTEIGGNA